MPITAGLIFLVVVVHVYHPATNIGSMMESFNVEITQYIHAFQPRRKQNENQGATTIILSCCPRTNQSNGRYLVLQEKQTGTSASLSSVLLWFRESPDLLLVPLPPVEARRRASTFFAVQVIALADGCMCRLHSLSPFFSTQPTARAVITRRDYYDRRASTFFRY